MLEYSDVEGIRDEFPIKAVISYRDMTLVGVEFFHLLKYEVCRCPLVAPTCRDLFTGSEGE